MSKFSRISSKLVGGFLATIQKLWSRPTHIHCWWWCSIIFSKFGPRTEKSRIKSIKYNLEIVHLKGRVATLIAFITAPTKTLWLLMSPYSTQYCLMTARENQQLVTNEPVGFWENNQLKFKTAGKSLIILEEFKEHTPIYVKKTGGCQHVTGWTCKH
jgi:hypothetical protein